MDKKMQEFRDFDFDGNQEWGQYFKKFDISGADYGGKLLRLKAKWYKKYIDEDFDVSSASEASAASPASSAKPMPQESKEHTPSSQGSSPQSSSQRSSASSSSMMFLCHALLLILGSACVLPFSTGSMHQYFLLLAIATHGLKVVNQFGRPPFRPWSALQAWAVTALPSTDFQYSCMSLIFVAKTPSRILFIPSTVLAAYHVVYFLAAKYGKHSLWKKYGHRLHSWMVENQRAALAVNATAEVALGILLLVQVLTPARNLISIFIYWQWLRTRYFSPDAAQYHRLAWHRLGEKANPILQRVPFVKIPLGYVQRWFTTPPAR